MTTARSRQIAVEAVAEDGDGHVEPGAAHEPGLRAWIRELAPGPGARAAAFDTRADKPPWLTGAASHGIGKRLRRRGYEVVDSQSFLVEDSEGPLTEGELDRARAWGAQLARSRRRITMNTRYPLAFTVQYPDRALDRLSSAFRIFTIVPIAGVLASIGGYSASWATGGGATTTIAVGGTGLLFLPPLLMIVFRQKYPRWWFDWNVELLGFANRVGVYLALMDDRYPATDDHQSVHLDLAYPDVRGDLNRWLPLVKWLLAIPHYVVLFFLYVGALFAAIIAWFAILFTGRYPRGIFDFIEGVIRWHNRVLAYAFILVTDEYPPFRLAP